MALNRTAFWGVLAFVAAFSREVRTEELLFSDSFSARQGERPAAWAAVLAPTPRFWYVEENQLASGAGEDLGGSGYSFAVIQAPQSDQWTSCSIGAFFWMRSRTGRAVLVGRWRDENNHYEASVQVSPAGRSGYIDVVREGARKTLNYSVANLGVAIPAIEGGSRDKPHYLQFIMVGPILALYLDGDRLVEATDGSFDRGSAGVGVQHSMVFFDNVRVERARIAGPRSPIPRGAPDGAEGDQIYQLLMNIFASESDARRFQNDLAASGYLNVTVEAVEGRWHVAAGAFQTEAEAERERAYLESQGTRITGVVVRSRGTTQVLPVARRRTPSLPDKVFALRLGRFANLAEADALKRKLETDGVAGPEIRQEGARFAVVAGGFVTRPDAEKWRSSLEARKYKDLEVIEEARNSAPVVVAQAAQPLASATAPTAGISEYYMDIKNDVQKLRQEARSEIEKISRAIEQRESRQRQLEDLFGKINKAIEGRDYGAARKHLSELFTLDPTNLQARAIIETIDLREKELPQTISKSLTERQLNEVKQDIALATERAEDFERGKLYEPALNEYERIRSLLAAYNLEPERRKEVANKIAALKSAIEAASKAIETQFAKTGDAIKQVNSRVSATEEGQVAFGGRLTRTEKTLLPVLGVLGVLVLAVAFIYWSARRRNRLLLEQMRSLTLRPMMEIATAGGPSVLPRERSAGEISLGVPPMLEGKPAAREEKPTAAPDLLFGEITPEPPSAGKPSRSAPTAETVAPSAPPASAPQVLRGVTMQMPEDFGLSDISKAPEQDMPTPQSRNTPSQGTAVADISADIFPAFGPELPGQESTSLGEPEPVGPKIASAISPLDIEPELEPLRLDELIAEGETKVPPPPGGELPGEPRTLPLDLDLMGVGAVGPEAPPITGQKTGVFYEQSFEVEAVGAMPRNWEASEQYSFASLVVADDTPPPNAKRYLKFEKTEAAGSATYSCRFADATGQVAIEFDVRCDNKNKFLLGFYVEKDGDFRQSIHTLIHLSESLKAAALGLQGEKASYEMGTWRHVKYVVNLSTGRMTGYMDSETVLDNVKLSNCPRSLNTLSIRDNIPTVGVLLIGNIRITRA